MLGPDNERTWLFLIRQPSCLGKWNGLPVYVMEARVGEMFGGHVRWQFDYYDRTGNLDVRLDILNSPRPQPRAVQLEYCEGKKEAIRGLALSGEVVYPPSPIGYVATEYGRWEEGRSDGIRRVRDLVDHAARFGATDRSRPWIFIAPDGRKIHAVDTDNFGDHCRGSNIVHVMFEPDEA